MATRIAQESFTKALPELMPLFEMHWEELALFRDKMPLSPRVEAYDALEKLDELVTLTARSDGRLVGYLIAHIGPAMHYSTTKTGSTDLPYVHPDVRGRGIGVRLFLAAQDEMRRRGVGMWHSGLKINSRAGQSMHKLLSWMQFEPTDLLYSKWIGG